MTIATSRGFAVLTDEGLDMRTVSDTRRATIPPIPKARAHFAATE